MSVADSSGQVTSDFMASGAVVRAALYLTPIQSGTFQQKITGETVSGIRAVTLSQSGFLQIAMASLSGRQPAVGVVIDNVLSGLNANVYTAGIFQATSGLCDYSGFTGFQVFYGRSGHIVTLSGSFNSGSFLSGVDQGQVMGTVHNSGAFCLNVDQTVLFF